MNEGPRRRRRLDDDAPEGRGLPLILLFVVIVLVGLVLGAVLAHFFGKGGAPQPTPLPTVSVHALASATPSPLPSASPTPSPKPGASPRTSPSPTASPHASPSPSVKPSASPRPTASPSPKPTATPKPATPKPATPRPATPKPTAPPTVRATVKPAATHAPVASTDAQRADEVVRLYLDALARGNVAEARSYLASGGTPNESFMNRSARLNFVRHSQNGNGTYAVNADVTTDSGEYFFTFTVQVSPGGAVILDHTSIKP